MVPVPSSRLLAGQRKIKINPADYIQTAAQSAESSHQKERRMYEVWGMLILSNAGSCQIPEK
jgi:hypothetical protein